MAPLKIIVFLGSTRAGRMADRVGSFIKGHLTKKGFQVEIFDPSEIKFPVLETPIHFYPDPSKAPEWLVKLNGRIKAADGYVLVSAEYNNCVPPALTNMMNHFPPSSYAFKPSLIVSYSMGRMGGTVAASQLRSFTSILGCPSVPMALPIAEVDKALSESGESQQEHLDKSAVNAIDQLQWMASALHDKRSKDTPPRHLF